MADIQDQQMLIRNSAHTRREQDLEKNSQDQPIFTKATDVAKPPQHRELQLLDYQELSPENVSVQRRLGASSAQRRARSLEWCESQRKLQSAGLKGRLGHLKRAVADAHQNMLLETRPGDGSRQPESIEVYSCDKCDKMFCHAEEMKQHHSSCERLPLS